MNVKPYLVALAAAAAVLAVASVAQEGVGAKEAAAEKKGGALKLARAAELEKMRKFENVSPTLAVAVKSCLLQAREEPTTNEEAGSPSGTDLGEVAGTFFRAVGRKVREICGEVPPDAAKAGDGKVYVHVDVLIKNLSDITQRVLPADFTLATPDGYTVNYNVKTYAAADPFDAIYLPPGGSSGGMLVFVLPPCDEYTLHYYNPETKGAGTKRVLVTKAD